MVEWSSNRIEGLDKARSDGPDLVIIDRMLPGMDGLAVIEALRRGQIWMPVQVLSASDTVEERVLGSQRPNFSPGPKRCYAGPSKQTGSFCGQDRLSSIGSSGGPNAVAPRSIWRPASSGSSNT